MSEAQSGQKTAVAAVVLQFARMHVADAAREFEEYLDRLLYGPPTPPFGRGTRAANVQAALRAWADLAAVSDGELLRARDRLSSKYRLLLLDRVDLG